MYYIISKEDSQGNFYYLSKRLISSIRSMDFGNKNLVEQICWRKSSNFDNDFTSALKLHDPDLTRSLSWNISDRYPDLSIPTGITSPLDGETVNLLFVEVSFTAIDSSNYKEHVKRIAEGKLTDYELSIIMEEDSELEIGLGFPDSTEEPEDNTEEPEDNTEEPEDNTEEPEDNTEEPEDNTEEPEDNTEEPEDNTEEPEDNTEEPEDNTEEPEDNTGEESNEEDNTTTDDGNDSTDNDESNEDGTNDSESTSEEGSEEEPDSQTP